MWQYFYYRPNAPLGIQQPIKSLKKNLKKHSESAYLRQAAILNSVDIISCQVLQSDGQIW